MPAIGWDIALTPDDRMIIEDDSPWTPVNKHSLLLTKEDCDFIYDYFTPT
jgi:hypothetical protein